MKKWIFIALVLAYACVNPALALAQELGKGKAAKDDD